MDVSRVIIYRQIGAKVAYYRTLRQLTQDELAKKIHAYNHSISLSTLLDIADGLHIELSHLVSFTEEEKKVWWEADKDL